MQRSTNYTIAAILQAALSVMGITGALVYLPRGAEALNQGSDSPPYAVLIIGMAIGVLGLVSAWGVWKSKRWGVILTIVLRVVDGLLALPGMIFAPTPTLTILSTAGVVFSVVVIALLLWPQPRPQATEST
jgi:uncharacterized membrane protein (DUF2068 family)